jgi:DNA helicase-2/ATP-dependent DNA helicase PcrA
MRFYADLHIHSRYSRATSRDCKLPELARWAQLKGLAVLGTGDFTHPGWRAEIDEQLVAAEPGLFRLRPDLERAVTARLPAACQRPLRFCLTVEIATIYKRAERTRKVHHLLLAGDRETAGRLVAALEAIGNLRSDGRPILGLDSRDLLEIALECGPGCHLIPAHIWTPWFSALGSKSGFDSIADCYGPLSRHLFAVETGLSSDPAMNWRVSALDGYRLVSNSDAHSPAKLGREACAFDCELSFPAMMAALRSGDGYRGTVEFFPEEGKYHLDGHRKCAQCLEPAETRRLDGRCPVCGRPLTVGVMHRVEELADRAAAAALQRPPASAGAVRSLVPLAEVLGEILGVGPNSKRVQRSAAGLLERLGPELELLWSRDLEDVRRATSPLAAEALRRLRAGEVRRQPGYDGAYGRIRLFDAGEIDGPPGGLLFDLPAAAAGQPGAQPAAPAAVAAQAGAHPAAAAPEAEPAAAAPDALDADQRRAVDCAAGVVLIEAGPGSGKTRVLVQRLVRRIAAGAVEPEHCLAITFTRRAAEALRDRLVRSLGGRAERVSVSTLHALALDILRRQPQAAGLADDFGVADEHQQRALLSEALAIPPRRAPGLLERLAQIRRGQRPASAQESARLAAYRQALRRRRLIDFDDLMLAAAELLERDAAAAAAWRERYRCLSVDELQDTDAVQQRLLLALAGPAPDLCAIGDPDQSIYGFRGADPSVFARLRRRYPQARCLRLGCNYRCSPAIAAAAAEVLGRAGQRVATDWPERIALYAAPSERAEAEFVVHSLEQLVGGHSFFSLDSGRSTDGRVGRLGFGDVAVLYRSDAQAEPLVEALQRSGIPFQKRSHDRLLDLAGVRALADSLRQRPGRGDLRRRLALRVRKLAELPPAEGGCDAGALRAARDLLAPLAAACGDDAQRFLAELACGAQIDALDPRADAVALLSLHAAKGLEYEAVFITGCEDGLLPLRFGGRAAADAAEEQRLFYVGMTRARRQLWLTRARRRKLRGRRREAAPSPFLAAIAERWTETLKRPMPRGRKRRRDQLDLW